MFYLAIIQNKTTKALNDYPSLDAALAAFHSELAYRANGRTSTMCLIIDEFGNPVKKEYWEVGTEASQVED